MIFAPARWMSLPLTPAEVDVKLAALRTHRTQAAVMDGLFRAFARPNEFFGVIDRAVIPTLAAGTPPCGPELPAHPDERRAAAPRHTHAR
jgi:hypothetical protein